MEVAGPLGTPLGLAQRPATPLFSPACWEPGFQAWAHADFTPTFKENGANLERGQWERTVDGNVGA